MLCVKHCCAAGPSRCSSVVLPGAAERAHAALTCCTRVPRSRATTKALLFDAAAGVNVTTKDEDDNAEHGKREDEQEAEKEVDEDEDKVTSPDLAAAAATPLHANLAPNAGRDTRRELTPQTAPAPPHCRPRRAFRLAALRRGTAPHPARPAATSRAAAVARQGPVRSRLYPSVHSGPRAAACRWESVPCRRPAPFSAERRARAAAAAAAAAAARRARAPSSSIRRPSCGAAAPPHWQSLLRRAAARTGAPQGGPSRAVPAGGQRLSAPSSSELTPPQPQLQPPQQQPQQSG